MRVINAIEREILYRAIKLHKHERVVRTFARASRELQDTDRFRRDESLQLKGKGDDSNENSVDRQIGEE